MLRLSPAEALAHPFLAAFVTSSTDHPPAWRPSRRGWRHRPHDPLQLRKRWNLRWVPDETSPLREMSPPKPEGPARSVRLSSGMGSVRLHRQPESPDSRRLSNSNGQGFVIIKSEPLANQ